MTVLLRDVTEPNRMAAALREAHDRAEWLARFPEENPNPVMRVSADGSILYCNPAAAKTPGWACKVGETLTNQLLPLVGRAMAEGAEAEQGLELGGTFYSVWVAPFPGESYVNVYARDITERKKTEEALRRYELLSAHTRDIILFMRRDDGRILEANSAAANAYGYSHDELLALSIQDLRLPDARGLTAEQMAEADTQGILFETVHHRKDGSTFHVEVSSRGATIGGTRTLISVIRDITARKRAEEDLRQRSLELRQLTERLEERVRERTAELAESTEKLRAEMSARLRLVAAVEQAGEGVAITNPEGLIDYVNPAFERISGIGWEEILGKNYYEILADENLKKKIQSSVGRDETWSGRVNRRKKDGQSFALDVTLSPIRDGSGAVINYLAMERDVTQELRLEQHLRQMQKVEALGTLAGGIAHDFNNILNPIFINTELVLLDAPPGSPMRPPLQLVLEAAERGKNLVKQIITFSRQKEHEAKPLKAEPLIKEALKFLRASLPSTVEIREKIRRETGFILADPTQIHQVVMNLCGNAAYAMREKGGVLEVSLAEVEADADMARLHPDLRPGPYLRLTVSDTGAGMTREVMERVFDPFFTTKKPGEGSGMGLSVVHGIVRKGKGAITVYSEVGKGSTFNVFFPRVEDEAPSLKVSSQPIARGRERILLVDDEEVQVQSIRNMLERLGYAVAARNDSVEALALFRKDPRAFDLVITDQTMPQMTGVRLAEEVMRIRPDMPVVLCTGFSETVDADGVKASGICQFLMKPFSAREMAETIRRALGKK
jgi:PAS domain S-box-containing protein